MASPEGALLTQKIRMNMEEFKKTCEHADLRGKKAAGIGRERFGDVGGIYNDHGTYRVQA